jgi:hypothetical protein
LTKRVLRTESVYAVVRVDLCAVSPVTNSSATGPSIMAGEHEITVKAVVRSISQARSEVARLNALNSDKGCRYFWQMSRLLPEGRPLDSGASAAPRGRDGRNRAKS